MRSVGMNFEFPEWFDKQLLNTLLLFLIVFWLSRERKKLKELLSYHLDALRQQVLAVREEAESVQEQPEAAAQLQNWEDIRTKWADARERIEVKIEQLDGRVRRKYGRMTRYNYDDIIRQLAKDGALSPEGADALLDMNSSFFALRPRPAQVTLQDVLRFARHYQTAAGDLPSIGQ